MSWFSCFAAEARCNNIQLGRFGRNRTNVRHYPGTNVFKRNGRKSDLDLHPIVKPIVMVADAILGSTNLDNVILDPFLGSGTTLLAANAHGGVLDPLYVDTVVTRWALDPATSAPGPRANPSMTSEARGARSERPGRSYEVGYGRTPKGTRSKKGRSENTSAKKHRTSSCGYGRNYRKWSCA